MAHILMMDTIQFWTKWCFWRILHLIFHTVMAVYYWGRGKKVPPIKNPLLFKSAMKLAEEIREGKLKSEEVVQAYIDRILEVEPYINAVAQERFQDALKEAKEADALVLSEEYTKQQLEAEKPLLGVPFTVKMLLTVKGLRSTGGSTLFKDVVAAEDSPSVTLLKKAGGIVLATTNAPEFGFSFETNNFVHGRTCNPYDTSKTPGGSSGGESALLGAGASLIGLGNDLVGSVRVPAHFTGIFSHKATMGLIPNSGTFPVPHPDMAQYVYTGPMCRFSEDLITVTKILTTGNEKRLKFDQEINFKKMRLFYATSISDPSTLPVDMEIIKAMYGALNHFTKTYGVKAIEVRVPLLHKSNPIVTHNIQGPISNVTEFITSGKVKNMNFFSELFKFFIGKSTFTLPTIVTIGLSKFPLLFRQKNVSYYREVLKKLGDEFEDLLTENAVFMYPTFPITAPYHQEMLPLIPSTCYTSIFNFLGLPVTNVPLGLNRNGMPHGMQIISRKDNDALTLACAAEIGKVFGGWIPPGCR